jgi:hypothetical protein
MIEEKIYPMNKQLTQKMKFQNIINQLTFRSKIITIHEKFNKFNKKKEIRKIRWDGFLRARKVSGHSTNSGLQSLSTCC